MADKTLAEIARQAWCNTNSSDYWQTVADAVIAEYEARRWKAIETAPKDGTRVYIYIPAFKEWPAIVDVSHFHQPGKQRGYWWNFLGVTPTHWTAIPAPPKEVDDAA